MKKKYNSILDQERDSWEENYKKYGYENVINITRDPAICKKITDSINSQVTNILIPGCGNQTYLQRVIIEHRLNVKNICCTDWSETAILSAKAEFKTDKVSYVIADSSNMPFRNELFDAALICNSILSQSDSHNIKILSECNRVLKPNGLLCGFFPSIFSVIDLNSMASDNYKWSYSGDIDLIKNQLTENKQKLKQTFYSPLNLRKRIINTGFALELMDIYFFDSDILLSESEDIYDISKEQNMPIWELFIVARKIS